MKTRPVCLAVTLALLACLVFQTVAQAAKGTPDSPDFGYGAQIHLDGEYSAEALQTASQLKLDWVEIEFDWARIWPVPTQQPSLQRLDQAMQIAAQQNLAVLLSLTGAPTWVLSAHGPDATLTAQLVVELAKRYPNSLKGVELFPAANTLAGWGATPDPVAYFNLFHTVSEKLHANGAAVNLVAAGLTPLAPAADPQDVDDLAFLSGLYTAGAAGEMPILSLRFEEVSGDPLQAPTQANHRVLRHYEEVRQVMLANRHAQGILWITRFGAPSGTIQAGEAQQSDWLSQAYRQLRAQLYVGAAFVADLNPAGDGSQVGLIATDGSRHSFLGLLGRLIDQNNSVVEAASGPTSSFIKFILHLAS